MEPRRKVLTLSLDGAQLALRFVRERPGYVHDWSAALDGAPLMITLRQVTSQVGYADRRWERDERGELVNLGAVVEALADAGVERAESGVVIDISCAGAHYNQNTFGTVKLTRHGASLIVDAHIQNQDDSYY